MLRLEFMVILIIYLFILYILFEKIVNVMLNFYLFRQQILK